MIVLDASVAAKCYLAEANSDKAIELMAGDAKLFAPELIRVEVSGAICRHVREGKLTEDEVKLRCDKWRQHLAEDVVSLVPDKDLLSRAELLAIELRHPVQDCLYLALAQQHDVPLVTADDVFQKKAIMSNYIQVEALASFRVSRDSV